MLASQRHERILDALRESGAVRVSDLTDLLNVSYMTIRRDLDALAERRLIEKVHGGAMILSEHSGAEEPGFEAKSLRERDEKDAIARAAASLVRPGIAIGLTAGTTTFALARHLGEIADLTVVTNSIPVSEALHDRSRTNLSVVLTGGLRTPSDALVGPVAEAAIESVHVDMLFMGVHGMDERAGFTTPNLLEAQTNRAFVRSARRLIVVADHTKWGVVGLTTMARLDEAAVVVTDATISAHARETVESHVGELVLAPVDRNGDGSPMAMHARGARPRDER